MKEVVTLNENEIKEINKDAKLTAYARNNVKAMRNEISDIAVEIGVAEEMMQEGLLDPEAYKNFVHRKRIEVKNMIAQIFGYMNLQEVKGYFDKVFEKHELMREFISEVDKDD